MLYPSRCAICDGIPAKFMEENKYICSECTAKVIPAGQPACLKCGKPLEDAQGELCHDCTVKKHTYDRGVAAFVYSDAMKKSMYAFKYNNRREYAKYYAKEIYELYGHVIESFGAQALIPVPLYKSKLRKRGYNQAKVLADSLAMYLDVPVDDGVLVRVKNTKPQKMLDDANRVKNLEKAFQIRKDSVKYNKVIIVDDIYTTGSTIDGCAQVLKEAGVEKVYFVTACAGRGF